MLWKSYMRWMYTCALIDDKGNEVDNEKCPFCRAPDPTTDEEIVKRLRGRIEADNPIAICNLGCHYRDGEYGFKQDLDKALELWHRAAELGYADAYCGIGLAYTKGKGVEVDKKKAIHYFELSAMGGNAIARHNLGLIEKDVGNMDRALNYYMIATAGGYADSLDAIKGLYSEGFATKEDYTKALRSYQAYLSEIKSDQRDKAAAARDDYRYY